MVGKRAATKAQVTQEQLHMARLLDSVEKNKVPEKDKAKHQDAIKKIMEMTACTQETAEIALLDHGTIEDSVLAIVDRGSQDLEWNETTNRKVKKPEGKKDKTDKNQVRANDRSQKDMAAGEGKRARDGATHGQGTDRNRDKHDRNYRPNHLEVGNASNRQSNATKVADPIATRPPISMVKATVAPPESGRTWSSIVKSDPPPLELKELKDTLVDAQADALKTSQDDDEEFTGDYHGKTFTNAQYPAIPSKEQTVPLFREGVQASQTSPPGTNATSNAELSEHWSEEANTESQPGHDKTLHSLTNMLKKDIGLPVSGSTTTMATAEIDEIRTAQRSYDSLVDNHNSPVVFMDNARFGWNDASNLAPRHDFSFDEIQGTVEFVDRIAQGGQLLRNEVNYDSYGSHQLSLSSSGIASSSPPSMGAIPTPESFGFEPIRTIIDIPPTSFPPAVDNRPIYASKHPQLNVCAYVRGKTIDVYKDMRMTYDPIQGVQQSGSMNLNVFEAKCLQPALQHRSQMQMAPPPGISNCNQQPLSCLQAQPQMHNGWVNPGGQISGYMNPAWANAPNNGQFTAYPNLYGYKEQQPNTQMAGSFVKYASGGY